MERGRFVDLCSVPRGTYRRSCFLSCGLSEESRSTWNHSGQGRRKFTSNRAIEPVDRFTWNTAHGWLDEVRPTWSLSMSDEPVRINHRSSRYRGFSGIAVGRHKARIRQG